MSINIHDDRQSQFGGPMSRKRGGFGRAETLVTLAILAAVGYSCYRYIFGGMRQQGAAGNVVTRFDPNAFEGGDYGDWAPAASAVPASNVPAAPTVAATTSDPSDEPEKVAEAAPASTKAPAKLGLNELTKTLGSVSGVVGKISDVESAKAALPELEAISKKLDDVSSDFAALPAAEHSIATAAIAKLTPKLEATRDKVLAIPGVKDVLESVIDSILAKVRKLTS